MVALLVLLRLLPLLLPLLLLLPVDRHRRSRWARACWSRHYCQRGYQRASPRCTRFARATNGDAARAEARPVASPSSTHSPTLNVRVVSRGGGGRWRLVTMDGGLLLPLCSAVSHLISPHLASLTPPPHHDRVGPRLGVGHDRAGRPLPAHRCAHARRLPHRLCQGGRRRGKGRRTRSLCVWGGQI